MLQPYNMLTAFCSMQTPCMTHVWHMHGTYNTWYLGDVCMLYACSMPVTCKLHACHMNEHSIDATCIWHASDTCAVYMKHPWRKRIMHAQCPQYAFNMHTLCSELACMFAACVHARTSWKHARSMSITCCNGRTACIQHAYHMLQHVRNMHAACTLHTARWAHVCYSVCHACNTCYMPQDSSYAPGTCVIHATNGRYMHAIWVEHVVYMHIACYKM